MFAVSISKELELYQSFGLKPKKKLKNDELTLETKPQKPKNKKEKIRNVCEPKPSQIDNKQFSLIINDKIISSLVAIFNAGKSASAIKVAASLFSDDTIRKNFISKTAMQLSSVELFAFKSKDVISSNIVKSMQLTEDFILEKKQVLSLFELAQLVEGGYNIRTIYILDHPNYTKKIHVAIKELMIYIPITYLKIAPDGFCEFLWNPLSLIFLPLVRYTGTENMVLHRHHEILVINNSNDGEVEIMNAYQARNQRVNMILAGRRYLVTFTSLCNNITPIHTPIILSNLGKCKLGMTVRDVKDEILLYGSCLSSIDVIISGDAKITRIQPNNRVLIDVYANSQIIAIDASIDQVIKSKVSKNATIGHYRLNIGIHANKGSGKSSSSQYFVNAMRNIPKVKENGLTVGSLDSDAYNVYLKYGDNSNYDLDYVNGLVEQHKTGLFEDLALSILKENKITGFRSYFMSQPILIKLMKAEFVEYHNTDGEPSLRSFIRNVATSVTRPDILFMQVHSTYEIPSLHATDHILSLTPMWNLERAIIERKTKEKTTVNKEVERSQSSHEDMMRILAQLLLLNMHETSDVKSRQSSYISTYLSEIYKLYGTFV